MMKISSPLMALVVLVGCSNGFVSGKTDFNDVGRSMAVLLRNKHFADIEFNAELSDQILDDYLADLDPAKLYFTENDVDGFEQKYGANADFRLDELLLEEKGMEPAMEVYSLFAERVRERVTFVENLVENEKFDFAKIHF